MEQNTNTVKTLYVLRKRPNKRQKLDNDPVANEGISLNDPKIPFLQLLQGQEPIENVKIRHELFSSSMKRQEKTSKRILDEISDQTLSGITSIVKSPIKTDVIDTALLLSSTSFSATSTFITQLGDHLGNEGGNKVIRLSSKECNTIKITLKKIVSSILNDDSLETNGGIDDDSDEENGYSNEEISDSEEDEDEEDEIDYSNGLQRRALPFDLDRIDDWCMQMFRRRGETFETTNLRVVLLFEDTDSFNMRLLNNLLRLLHCYNNRIPLKLIFNVGTSVENFAKKLDNELHYQFEFHQFKIEQTESILNKIVSEIIVENEYLIGNETVNFLLKRFENSARDINELLKSIKFLKMCFFFNQPLSVIGSLYKQHGIPILSEKYYEAIRMMPSFKAHIEQLIRSEYTDQDEVLDLLSDDSALQKLVIKSTSDYLKNFDRFKSTFSIITNILTKYCKLSSRNYLEYFAKLTNMDDLIKNQFINEILMSLKRLESDQVEQLLEEINQAAEKDELLQSFNLKIKANVDFASLKSNFKDPEYSVIQYKIDFRKSLETLTSVFEFFLKNSFKNPFDMLFNEFFQLNGLDILKSTLIPQTRTVIEDALTDPELYINIKQDGASAIEKLNAKVNPVIAELFQIYRETSLNLNIYDFYEVFKNSLRKESIMKDLNEVLDSSDNLLEKFLNDDARFKFIYQFFNDVDISEDAKWDKLTLVLFLQKCGELIACGFLKQIKRKGDSLEKCVWRGL